MSLRHRAREIALQILYRYDVASTAGTPAPTGSELVREIQGHFEHFAVQENLRGFAAELVAGTLQNMPELDQLLEKHSSNWKISRLGFVDRSLLRMAIHEMRNFPETAPTVVIDEAVELAKEFGTAETPAFVNGILDAIKGNLSQSAVSAHS